MKESKKLRALAAVCAQGMVGVFRANGPEASEETIVFGNEHSKNRKNHQPISHQSRITRIGGFGFRKV